MRGELGFAARIELRDVVVRFEHVIAVDALSVTVEPGEILALLGPSGCGKTTTLRVVAGLQDLQSGMLLFNGEPVQGIAPHRRNVGMVFQNYALFPHMTVRENISFGLRMHRIPRAQAARKISAILDLLQIGHLAGSFPDQLSGGQQQRAALARTLVVEPALLLLDEPLSALDRQLRDVMRGELRQLLKAVGITTIIVTHDQDEALTLSDRIAIMRNGRIEQIGPPREVYRRPATRFVASFLGSINYIAGEILSSGGRLLRIKLTNGEIIPAAVTAPLALGRRVELAVRPEAIQLLPKGSAAAAHCAEVAAKVERIVFQGGLSTYHLRLTGGIPITVSQTPNARSDGSSSVDLGDEVMLSWPIDEAAMMELPAEC